VRWLDIRTRSRFAKILLGLAPVFLALVFTTLILFAVRSSPWKAYRSILVGAFGSREKIADVVAACVPLVLCGAGVAITFTAGQWNVGVEGQIVLGALFATWMAQSLAWPQAPLLTVMLLAGALGGALWGVLAGLLKVYGRVHEIFGGLGLNYLAKSLAIWLIFNPWRPADGATMSGTDPFPDAAWMPRLGDLRVAPLAVILALVAVAVVAFLLRGTRFGLELKALGKNFRSASLMGVPSVRRLLTAFAACGALAGLAGAIRCSARYGRMIPDISGGQGYLSLLLALLVGFRPLLVPVVALFFAGVGVGSTRLELDMHLDSALGGVLRTSVVLAVMLVSGWRALVMRRRSLQALAGSALVPEEEEDLG